MRVVVMGRNGAGSRSHYITGHHGPVVSGSRLSLFPIGTVSYGE